MVFGKIVAEESLASSKLFLQFGGPLEGPTDPPDLSPLQVSRVASFASSFRFLGSDFRAGPPNPLAFALTLYLPSSPPLTHPPLALGPSSVRRG